MLMYERFLKGEITKEEWIEYCQAELEKLMEANRKVLENLKNI